MFEVYVTNKALGDLDSIYNYIANVKESPKDAINQCNRITDAILTLKEFPNRFVKFTTEPEHSMGIHKMIVDNYLICYVINSKTVTVTNVLYGASDIHNSTKY